MTKTPNKSTVSYIASYCAAYLTPPVPQTCCTRFPSLTIPFSDCDTLRWLSSFFSYRCCSLWVLNYALIQLHAPALFQNRHIHACTRQQRPISNRVVYIARGVVVGSATLCKRSFGTTESASPMLQINSHPCGIQPYLRTFHASLRLREEYHFQVQNRWVAEVWHQSYIKALIYLSVNRRSFVTSRVQLYTTNLRNTDNRSFAALNRCTCTTCWHFKAVCPRCCRYRGFIWLSSWIWNFSTRKRRHCCSIRLLFEDRIMKQCKEPCVHLTVHGTEERTKNYWFWIQWAILSCYCPLLHMGKRNSGGSFYESWTFDTTYYVSILLESQLNSSLQGQFMRLQTAQKLRRTIRM